VPREPDIRTRQALPEDAAAIARIYNEGIADRIATFDTVPGMTEQVAAWFRPGVLIVVGEADGAASTSATASSKARGAIASSSNS